MIVRSILGIIILSTRLHFEKRKRDRCYGMKSENDRIPD